MKRFLLAAFLVCGVAVFPALARQDSAPAKSRHESTESRSREGTTRIMHRSSEEGIEVEMNLRGVRFDDEYTDVVSIEPGGFLELRESRQGQTRKLEIEPDASGQLQYFYRVGGKQSPFDAEGRAWLARALKDRIEEGFDATARVAKLFRTRGARGVLDAAKSLRSGYARAVYFRQLLKLDGQNEETVGEVLRGAAGEKFSDYERANILSVIAKQPPSGSRARNTFFEAVGDIKSDYDRSRVLLALLKREGLGEDWALAAVAALSATSSDYEKARVLLAAINAYPENERVRAAVLDAASRLGSEYERKRVVSAVSRAKKSATTEL